MALGIPSYRPPASGVTHVVSSGHQLAAQAGFRILEEGGNAIDAGVASGIAINTVLPQYTSFGGVAPIILHHAAKNETVTISGLGGWPKAASIELFRQRYGGDMPNGIMRTVVPSAVDAWLTALRLYGTMSFEQIVTPALEIAEKGYPIPYTLHEALAGTLDYLSADMDAMDGWTGTSGLFFPNGKALNTGDVLIQQDLANTFQRMIDAERHANHLGREGAIQAARDLFYTGDIAEDMVRFCQEQGGLLTMEDLASFKVQVEAPAAGSYKGIDVLTCGPWCQGPVVIQALQILEAVDLASMEYNGADYAHHVVEALKLAYSDRHAYYGDPDFVDVPMAGLMSKEYAGVRSQAIDPRSAFPGMPEPGDPRRMRTYRDVPQGELVATGDGGDSDTSYTCVIDRWGNAFSATPSDTLPTSPIVPGLGFILSSRGSQSWLDADHPSSLAPGKRPRLTPNPAMAMRDGKPWMTFGTPGGDVQCQSMVQLFLNVVEHGMDPQQAVEAPRFATWSFPNSFWPHTYRPAMVGVEGRIPAEVSDELARRGHKVEVWDDFTGRMGSLSAIVVDRERGMLSGGADPRRDSYAIAR